MGRSADQERIGPVDQRDVDDTGCHFLHVDMDSFFVSVEVRANPALRGRPVVVGGAGGWGVVASASYEARAYGVRSAMPMAKALRLCPNAVVVAARHEDYGAASADVMAILRDITPLVQPLSLDEAFLDVSGAVRLLGGPRAIARQIRRRISDELQLTCSVGVAARMFVAKIASTRCKPDGMLVVPEAQTVEFLRPLPVSALWGIGPKATARLEGLGLFTVGDVADARRQTLVSNLGRAQADHLVALASGHDPRRVAPERVDKSLSAEHTYFHTLSGHAQVESELARLAHKVARRLRAKQLQSRTIGLKLRAADFATYTRDVTIDRPTDLAQEIHARVVELWRGAERGGLAGRSIRLLGVRAGGLVEAGSVPVQLSLEDAAPEPGRTPRWHEAERALDAVVARFGGGALKPASTLRRPDPPRSAEENSGPGS
ncbi:DNA polymerase IV [Blastococcus sp. Marseille-P5729]|uniref:DNA polymerase IV n=1 Tax=Blastococcus sp. Marseille-P5729 TaxID=2086582 RepID=UPI000D101FD7|nr:DNA polymerase IV [Blastococcus sp. Marseille-P5729]